jgi:hypothetical protein
MYNDASSLVVRGNKSAVPVMKLRILIAAKQALRILSFITGFYASRSYLFQGFQKIKPTREWK